MERYKDIDEKIKLGYEYARKQREPFKACDIWLEAWEGIKAIYEEEKPEFMDEFDKKYKWYEPFLLNFVQDLEIELGNAGRGSDEYLKRRIQYCEEMIKIINKDELLTIENTKRAIADSHYELGDKKECVLKRGDRQVCGAKDVFNSGQLLVWVLIPRHHSRVIMLAVLLPLVLFLGGDFPPARYCICQEI